ncbi:MFS transporter [Conexibacter sp. JD483]|uniref:MFS transporter n=1 Tax=unclassified Conexibacter TaxID=2627773 RepID=UPI00271F2575|nr:MULTISPECIES: MFS transporter [unclassified Conexibacter]MDO8189384.1 MFS transporter [Conexibacter sp. CPCC 205706]MDO8201091.1 MFS transporter [Conexibacter sp. CPCC 205762]MDR9372447.1 MFS transporter [Conexibacter sp. JD483]
MMHDDPRRWWALAALALGVLVVGLDATIVNVALPTLADELDASTSQLQWIANAYNLVFAAALLPAGLLGDRFGRKRLLLASLALFGVASLGCALASNSGQLIAARALLGLGGAGAMPLSMAVLPGLFGERERAKAVSAWVGATALALPLGPILGGLLLDRFAWGSIFLINVPVVIAGLVAIVLLVPESRASVAPRIDLRGIALSATGLALLTFGAIEAGERGWGDAAVLAELGGAVALLALFGWMQVRLARTPGGHPLIDLALLQRPRYVWATLLATVVSFAVFGLLFVAPQYFAIVEGSDALGTGLKLLPLIGGLVVGSRAGERLLERLGTKAVLGLGFALMAGGLAAGATTDLGSGYGFAAVWIAVVGAGFGLALPTAMHTALGELSAERAGSGSALIQAVRQVGGTLGVALLGTILAAQYAGPGDSRQAFLDGMDTLLLVSAAAAAVALLLTLVALPRGAPAAEAAQSADGIPV